MQKHIDIPTSIFRDRTVKPLEAISEYLKDDVGLSFHEIGELLNRNERTVWTCYRRAKKKRANSNLASEQRGEKNE